MAAYRIFGDSISGNCLKVKWTADLLDLDYEWIETEVLKGQSRTAQFLALNPAGQVPLIITPGDRALAQSNAILLHLAETHPERGGAELLPVDPHQRAKVYEWLFWEQYSHEPYIAVRRFLKTYLRKADKDIDSKLFDRGVAALTRMERQLDGEAWIAGDDFSLADIALLAYTRVAHEGGFDLSAFPATKDWVGRAERRLGLEPV
jgi:glutathione S-transferase